MVQSSIWMLLPNVGIYGKNMTNDVCLMIRSSSIEVSTSKTNGARSGYNMIEHDMKQYSGTTQSFGHSSILKKHRPRCHQTCFANPPWFCLRIFQNLKPCHALGLGIYCFCFPRGPVIFSGSMIAGWYLIIRMVMF